MVLSFSFTASKFYVDTLLRDQAQKLLLRDQAQKLSMSCPPSWLIGCCGKSYPESRCHAKRPSLSRVSTVFQKQPHVILYTIMLTLSSSTRSDICSRCPAAPIYQGIQNVRLCRGGYGHGGLRISDNLIYPLYCSHMIYDVDLENGIRKLQSCAILLAYNVSIVGFLIFFYSCYDLTQSCQQFQ